MLILVNTLVLYKSTLEMVLAALRLIVLNVCDLKFIVKSLFLVPSTIE